MRISDWSSDVCSSDLFSILLLTGAETVLSGPAPNREVCDGRAAIGAAGVDRDHRAVPARRRADLVAPPSTPSDDTARAETGPRAPASIAAPHAPRGDRKSTRLNSSH